MLIVTGSDDNYVPGVLVLIASAALHNPGTEFVVLDLGIRPENRARIVALGQQNGIGIRLIQVDEAAFERLKVQRSHLTRGCYLRLLIPELMPELDRAIYMDSDMVVLGSLAELERVELGDNAIAAALCPTPPDRELAATACTRASYVNSGLLVLNLTVWRRDRISEACFDILSSPDRDFMFEDQSAINITCRGRTVLLPRQFNVHVDQAAYKKIHELPEDPIVLHYIFRNKPWTRKTMADDIWHHHANRIQPFLPPLTIDSRSASELHRKFKNFLGVLMRRRKYLDRSQIEKAWRSLSQGYIASQQPTKPIRRTTA
jgi:lipopolysaccharide biosynthesis glycosyltransferase